MFRVPRGQIFRKTFLNPVTHKTHGRQQSSSSGGGSGKALFGLIGVSAAAVGGTVLYAKYDDSFRKKLEDVVGSGVLDSVLGPKEAAKGSPQTKVIGTEESKLKLKLEREAKAVNQTKDATTKTSNTQEKTVVKQEPEKPKPVSKPSRPEVETTKRNVQLTESINKSVDNLEKNVKETIAAQRQATSLLTKYSTTLGELLEAQEPDQSSWNALTKLSDEKEKAVEKSVKKLSETRVMVENLKGELEKAKKDRELAGNASLAVAEEALARVMYQLDSSEKSMSHALSKHKNTQKYQEIFNTSAESLDKELNSVVPGYKSGKKLSEDELNVLIAHAHKKIKQIYKQMAKLEATEKERLDKALELQKAEDERVSDTKIGMELTKRKSELESEYQNKMNKVKDDLEAELRQQLKRQLAAHHDHLVEQLLVQRMELERAYNLLLEEKVLEERERYGASLRNSLLRLSEIEGALKAREQLDGDERKARELWLVCQLLKDALKNNGKLQPKEFAENVEAMKRTLGSIESKNSLAITALETIPEVALNAGVYTEDDLIERFKKVDTLCRRVALIGDEGGSLSLYMLSYLQSMLLFERKVNIEDELSGNQIVDATKWDTFAILSRVKHCLSERNLEMSLRYANQLRGEPRKVAKDWIADLRAHLELRQVADILQAQAASLTVRTLK